MRFKAWVLEHAVQTDNFVGDFIMDARADKAMPDVSTKAELLDYLQALNACEGALDGARQAWRRFERWATR